jgi:hypothetical protein
VIRDGIGQSLVYGNRLTKGGNRKRMICFNGTISRKPDAASRPSGPAFLAEARAILLRYCVKS